jgi:hypothetical protein
MGPGDAPGGSVLIAGLSFQDDFIQ